MPGSRALAAVCVGLAAAACQVGGATVQDAAPHYQAASDAYQAKILEAASTIQTTNPDAGAEASALHSMEAATRRFLGDLHQITFPDGMQAHVRTIESDSQSLADADLLLASQAGRLPRADVARWNQLDSAWRRDDKQLRQDLGLPVPDFDNR